MNTVIRRLCLVAVIITAVLLIGCSGGGCSAYSNLSSCNNSGSGSGSGNGNGNGSGSGSGPFTISGAVSGLAAGSTGLVLQDNATDNLTIAANGSFTFKTPIVSG